MWIRTQGKEKLIEVKKLTLSRMWKYDHKGDLQWLDSYCIKEEEGLELGVYSSKDKALKVLDMFEKCITGEMVFNPEYLKKFRDIGMGTFTARGFIKEMQRQVFQMPQDEEVV